VTREAQNASEYPVFERHREAVHRFAAAVPDPNLTVKGKTYRELRAHWETLGDPILCRHPELLSDRYDGSHT
jgi:hypothetical protein